MGWLLAKPCIREKLLAKKGSWVFICCGQVLHMR